MLPNAISKESIAKVIAACLSASFADCSLLRSSAKDMRYVVEFL